MRLSVSCPSVCVCTCMSVCVVVCAGVCVTCLWCDVCVHAGVCDIRVAIVWLCLELGVCMLTVECVLNHVALHQ